MSKLRILVLHNMGPKKRWFAGVSDVELIFPKYDFSNNYLTHNCYLKIPDFIQKYQFDAILMMSTFIDAVSCRGLNGDWFKQFKFIKDSTAVKIAFPQDDYWFSEIRDQFYVDYKIDRVYPICEPATWGDLIPNYLQSGGSVKQGYTTYITSEMLENKKYDKKWDERSFDIVYRAKKTPTVPNRFGYLKGIIGERFLNRAKKFNLKTNISTHPAEILHGQNWIRLLANGRSVLGSNSGSSVNLRNHFVQERLEKYQTENPAATWNEIEEMIFDKKDRNKSYTCISPRNLEAAMVGTLQILTPGSYSGVLKANRDFLLLEENCSNSEKIVYQLKNYKICKEMIDCSFNSILNKTNLQ